MPPPARVRPGDVVAVGRVVGDRDAEARLADVDPAVCDGLEPGRVPRGVGVGRPRAGGRTGSRDAAGSARTSSGNASLSSFCRSCQSTVGLDSSAAPPSGSASRCADRGGAEAVTTTTASPSTSTDSGSSSVAAGALVVRVDVPGVPLLRGVAEQLQHAAGPPGAAAASRPVARSTHRDEQARGVERRAERVVDRARSRAASAAARRPLGRDGPSAERRHPARRRTARR